MFRILQNDERRNHGQFLKNWFSGSSDAFIAVAFLKAAGWRIISAEVEAFLGRGGRMRMLVGTDFYLTEPAPLRELLRLGNRHPAFEWRMVESSAGSTFHPKYYRFRESKSLWLMTGSANLTSGGLSSNIETSVIIEDTGDGPLARECEKTEAALWVHNRTREPNEELIGRYAAAFELAKECAEQAKSRVTKVLESQPKLEGKRLADELTAYRADSKEQTELQSRRSNYVEGLRLINSLLTDNAPNAESFAAVYEKLVGERNGEKLWHSGSVYRSKTKVLSQWPDVLAMLKDIIAGLTIGPEEMYEAGAKWMEKIHGIGPNIFTEFCHTLDPKRFTPLNNNPVTSLRWLGVDHFTRPSAFKPEDYGRFCRCMERLRVNCGFADLGEADHFLNFVYWRHKNEAEALLPLTDFPLAELANEYGKEIEVQTAAVLAAIGRACPDCLFTQRKDDAWIFVPAERVGHKTGKNLITVWASANRLRLRIMPDEEEIFEEGNLSDYERRMRTHLQDITKTLEAK